MPSIRKSKMAFLFAPFIFLAEEVVDVLAVGAGEVAATAAAEGGAGAVEGGAVAVLDGAAEGGAAGAAEGAEVAGAVEGEEVAGAVEGAGEAGAEAESAGAGAAGGAEGASGEVQFATDTAEIPSPRLGDAVGHEGESDFQAQIRRVEEAIVSKQKNAASGSRVASIETGETKVFLKNAEIKVGGKPTAFRFKDYAGNEVEVTAEENAGLQAGREIRLSQNRAITRVGETQDGEGVYLVNDYNKLMALDRSRAVTAAAKEALAENGKVALPDGTEILSTSRLEESGLQEGALQAELRHSPVAGGNRFIEAEPGEISTGQTVRLIEHEGDTARIGSFTARVEGDTEGGADTVWLEEGSQNEITESGVERWTEDWIDAPYVPKTPPRPNENLQTISEDEPLEISGALPDDLSPGSSLYTIHSGDESSRVSVHSWDSGSKWPKPWETNPRHGKNPPWSEMSWQQRAYVSSFPTVAVGLPVGMIAYEVSNGPPKDERRRGISSSPRPIVSRIYTPNTNANLWTIAHGDLQPEARQALRLGPHESTGMSAVVASIMPLLANRRSRTKHHVRQANATQRLPHPAIMMLNDTRLDLTMLDQLRVMSVMHPIDQDIPRYGLRASGSRKSSKFDDRGFARGCLSFRVPGLDDPVSGCYVTVDENQAEKNELLSFDLLRSAIFHRNERRHAELMAGLVPS